MRGKHIVIAVNSSWNIVNFRSGLIRALVRQGYLVTVVAPEDSYSARIPELGCRYIPLPMDCHGTSPINDLMLVLRFLQVLRRERPHVFLGYTAKPNIFGSLAARALRIPVVNNIAGLGAAFAGSSWLTTIVRGLYRAAVKRSDKVFFQNFEDLQLFVEGRIVRASHCDVLPGSGVDLNWFRPARVGASPPLGHEMRFLFLGRLLWQKGVGEYVEAARSLKRDYPNVQFQILGAMDDKNPGAVSQLAIDDWKTDGAVEYLGSVSDVRPAIASADCVVLPTYYREGVPRCLLEAAAMAKPIVTTDWVGSRNVVDDGDNGYLCQPRSGEDLSRKLRSMIELSPHERSAMGDASRRKAVREFDEGLVIQRYTGVIRSILEGEHPRIKQIGGVRDIGSSAASSAGELRSRRNAP